MIQRQCFMHGLAGRPRSRTFATAVVGDVHPASANEIIIPERHCQIPCSLSDGRSHFGCSIVAVRTRQSDIHRANVPPERGSRTVAVTTLKKSTCRHRNSWLIRKMGLLIEQRFRPGGPTQPQPVASATGQVPNSWQEPRRATPLRVYFRLTRGREARLVQAVTAWPFGHGLNERVFRGKNS